MVANPPFPPLRYCKEGNENNLESVTYVAEHLPLKRELLIKKNCVYLYYFGVYHFSHSSSLAQLSNYHLWGLLSNTFSSKFTKLRIHV